MHGLLLERRLNFWLRYLGTSVATDQNKDWFHAIDAMVSAITPESPWMYESHETVSGTCVVGRVTPKPVTPIPHTITLQYTQKINDFKKLARFTKIAHERGGKHLYVRIKVAEDPWLFVVAKIIRDMLLELASRSCKRTLVWVLTINEDYTWTVRTPGTVINQAKRQRERLRQSPTRRQGKVFKAGRSVCLVDGGRGKLTFQIENVVDPELRQLLSRIVQLNWNNVASGICVSYEVRERHDGGYEAYSLLAEQGLERLKQLVWRHDRAQAVAAQGRVEKPVSKEEEETSISL